jgi:hypothetical protein
MLDVDVTPLTPRPVMNEIRRVCSPRVDTAFQAGRTQSNLAPICHSSDVGSLAVSESAGHQPWQPVLVRARRRDDVADHDSCDTLTRDSLRCPVSKQVSPGRPRNSEAAPQQTGRARDGLLPRSQKVTAMLAATLSSDPRALARRSRSRFTGSRPPSPRSRSGEAPNIGHPSR